MWSRSLADDKCVKVKYQHLINNSLLSAIGWCAGVRRQTPSRRTTSTPSRSSPTARTSSASAAVRSGTIRSSASGSRSATTTGRRDVQLDSGQHQRVFQVSRNHRAEQRLQSHYMQESGVSQRVMLGVFERVWAARNLSELMLSNASEQGTTRAALADAHAKISKVLKAESDSSSLRVRLLSAQQHWTQLKFDIDRNTKKCAKERKGV